MSALSGIFKTYNAKLEKLLLGPNNFQLIFIQDANGPNGENSLALIEVDRSIHFDGTTRTLAEGEEAKVERHIYFTRLNLNTALADVMKSTDFVALFEGLPATKGASAAHRTAFIEAVAETHTFTEDDIEVYVGAHYVSVVAKPMSLGYVGRVSVEMEGAPANAPVEPIEPWTVTNGEYASDIFTYTNGSPKLQDSTGQRQLEVYGLFATRTAPASGRQIITIDKMPLELEAFVLSITPHDNPESFLTDVLINTWSQSTIVYTKYEFIVGGFPIPLGIDSTITYEYSLEEGITIHAEDADGLRSFGPYPIDPGATNQVVMHINYNSEVFSQFYNFVDGDPVDPTDPETPPTQM